MTSKTVSELAEQVRPKYFPLKIGHYTVEPVQFEDLTDVLSKNFDKVFPKSITYTFSKAEKKSRQSCLAEYRKLHNENFVFKHKGKIIGWHMGEMDDYETFYMRNTGILPAHQNNGLYQAFLKSFCEYIFKLGYARISSQHSPHNSKILSVKLKNDFVIVGEETHERFGKLIKLVNFSAKRRRDFYLKKVDW